MRGRQKPLETVAGKRVIVTRSLSHKRFIAQDNNHNKKIQCRENLYRGM